MMEWYWLLAALILPVVGLSMLGIPVAISFLAVNLVAAYNLMGGYHGVLQTVFNATQSISSFALVPVMLFILMGDLFFRTGLAPRVFEAVDALIGRVPARMSIVAVGGGTVFASLSGSSMANTAMMSGTLAPAMFERRYAPSLVYGPIMGAGCLAALIPPSGLAVLLASLAEIPVGPLLIAGILPGLIIALTYVIMILVQVRINPSMAPEDGPGEGFQIGRAIRALISIAPLFLILFAVIGTIVFGLATPTESSALGALSVCVVAMMLGKFTPRIFFDALVSTAKSSALLLIIMLNSTTFAQVLSFSGVSSKAVSFALGFEFGPTEILVVMLVVLLLMGMFLDQTSMMMLTFPIFIPIAMALGYDMIWWGVLVLITLEMGLISPPFGLLLFVLQGTSPVPTSYVTVVKAAMPYFFVQLVTLALVIVFPAIVTWLPSLM